jgi:hypothetical protein
MPANKVNVKFGHQGEALEVIVWRGNYSQSVVVTAPEVLQLPRGRLAERAIMKTIEAVNKL